MDDKKQIDDVTQFILICITPVILASIPLGYMWIKAAIYTSQLPVTSVNF